MHCTKSKNPKVVLKERAEIVVVRRFLTYECGCGPHTTVRVVLKPNNNTYLLIIQVKAIDLRINCVM